MIIKMKNILKTAAVCILLTSMMCTAADEYGYKISLSWLGNAITNDMNLILRKPQDASSDNDYAPGDCYYGQENPDWGIINYDNDNPQWRKLRIGETNIEEIVAYELLDIGTYVVIARAHSGDAVCSIEIERWKYEDVHERDEKWLISNTTSREARYQRDSSYLDMGTRVLKFKQKKKSKKFKIKLDFTDLMDEMPTNERVRVYLDSELVLQDDGTSWQDKKKKKKWKLGNPWEMKVMQESNYRIYIRGIADGDYRSKTVQCNVMIGDYLGTNAFYVDKHASYKFKEKKEIFDND